MRIRTHLLAALLFILLLLPACQFRCSIGNADAGKTQPVEKDGMALYNGIELQANGLRVNKAYLVTNDENAERIGEGNFISLESGVKLVLLMDGGWQESNGRVWPGASMQVKADNGDIILNEEDLFANYETEGVTVIDAKVLSLSVYLSKLKPKRPVSFTVSFKVWDKKGEGLIEGGYTVHTK